MGTLPHVVGSLGRAGSAGPSLPGCRLLLLGEAGKWAGAAPPDPRLPLPPLLHGAVFLSCSAQKCVGWDGASRGLCPCRHWSVRSVSRGVSQALSVLVLRILPPRMPMASSAYSLGWHRWVPVRRRAQVAAAEKMASTSGYAEGPGSAPAAPSRVWGSHT